MEVEAIQLKYILRALNWGVLLLFTLGAAALYKYIPEDIITLKPAISFEDMLEEGMEVKAGDHISGRVPYVLDCFASESAYTQYGNGRTSSWDTGKYYLLPTTGSFIALKSRQSDVAALDALIDETWAYLAEDGAEPATIFSMEGKAVVLDDRPARFYREYLMDLGFTESDLDALGDPLVVERVNFVACWGMTAVGLGLLVLGSLLFRSSYRVAKYGYGHKSGEDSGFDSDSDSSI